MEAIPHVPLPEGFRMRNWREGEGPLWLKVIRAAETLMHPADDLFETEFGVDPGPASRRIWFIENAAGDVVGTLSGWISLPPEWTDRDLRIHWVAVHPDYQRRGLARAALSFVLEREAADHDRAWLWTSTGRPGAIALYEWFGFRAL